MWFSSRVKKVAFYLFVPLTLFCYLLQTYRSAFGIQGYGAADSGMLNPLLLISSLAVIVVFLLLKKLFLHYNKVIHILATALFLLGSVFLFFNRVIAFDLVWSSIIASLLLGLTLPWFALSTLRLFSQKGSMWDISLIWVFQVVAVSFILSGTAFFLTEPYRAGLSMAISIALPISIQVAYSKIKLDKSDQYYPMPNNTDTTSSESTQRAVRLKSLGKDGVFVNMILLCFLTVALSKAVDRGAYFESLYSIVADNAFLTVLLCCLSALLFGALSLSVLAFSSKMHLPKNYKIPFMVIILLLFALVLLSGKEQVALYGLLGFVSQCFVQLLLMTAFLWNSRKLHIPVLVLFCACSIIVISFTLVMSFLSSSQVDVTDATILALVFLFILAFNLIDYKK